MDRNNNNTNDNRSNAPCSSARCIKPDKCIHLRSRRQQKINQACHPAAETLYRMQNFKASGSDEDVFHDCLSISESDCPREGHSFKAFASCQSNLSQKHKLPGQQHSNDYAARCKASMSGNFDDPEAVRAALKRAENVTQMLLQNFEKSHKGGDDKHPCTATLEITARLIPDPKSARSKCLSQGRPVTVQMPLQFDPNTCQMITCQPIDERKSTDYPALMHMQDERQPPKENGPSSVSKKMQTDQSHLKKNYKGENMNDSDQLSQTDQPYPRREPDGSRYRDGIDPTRFSQTNTSYLYDIRSRPPNFVADQTSQTNLKLDIYKQDNFRYPTQYMRQVVDKNSAYPAEDEPLSNNADYVCSDHCGTLSQSKSQPSIPSKTLIQHSVSMNVAPDCSKSVPNVPMRSVAQRNPICDVDNATVFYSVNSEMNPKAASNIVFCSLPSYYTADTSSVHPVVERSSRDNATNVYSLESDITPSDGGPQNMTRIAAAQPFSDADDATNVCSIESDNASMAKASTAQPFRDADDATNVYSLNSDNATIGGGPDNMARTDSAQPSRVVASGPNVPCQNPCGLPSSTHYFPLGRDDNATAYFSLKSAKCVKRHLADPSPQNACAVSAQSGYDCERGNDNVTTCDSIKSGTSGPNIEYAKCHSADQPPVFRTEGERSKCTSCGPENSLYLDPVVTSLRKIVFCPSEHCNNSQIMQSPDGGNVYFDADRSTIMTSVKSRGIDIYDSDEAKVGSQPSECDGVVPFQKSSLGNVDKTSSRSQSVMAKVTCLCSSEEKVKLGMLGPEAVAGPPFIRMEESCAQDGDIEPADPLLISRTLPAPDCSNKSSSTQVVYMNRRENFCDCLSASDTSLSRKAKQQSTYRDVETGDSPATSKQTSHQKPQLLTVSCKSVEEYGVNQLSMPDFKSSQSCASVPDFKSVKSCAAVPDFKSVKSCAAEPDFKSAQSCATYTTCASVSKYSGASMPNLSLEPESVGVGMTCTKHTCHFDDAKENQQSFYECSSPKPLTAYQSCSTECSNAIPGVQRIVSILNMLSDAKDKSADRIVFIKQLFRELTILLRLEEEQKDGDADANDSPPLTCEECLEAVAAGKRPAAAAAQPKTKEQKERIECLDQMEKYLEKCFPLKKTSVPQTWEIAAFELDPDFDPKRKPGSMVADTSETEDNFFDVQSSSECQPTTSTYGDAKSTTDKSRDSKSLASEDATAKSRDSKSLDAKSEDSKLTDYKTPAAISSDSRSVDAKSGDSKLTDYKTPAAISDDSTSVDAKSRDSKLIHFEAPAAESHDSTSLDAKSHDSKITDSESTGAKSLDSKLPDCDSPDSKTGSVSKSPKLSDSVGESAKVEVYDENQTSPLPDEPETAVKIEVESPKPREEYEPTDNRAIQKSDCHCGDSDEQLGPLTDRERLLCEHMMRRMCEMCGEEEQWAEQQTDESHDHSSPCQPCVCCHCRALVCDNQCKTVSNTLDAIRYDPLAETKFFIDTIICDLNAMDHVLTKNKLQPKKSKPSPTMGRAPGESFPVTITDVSSLGCRALYVRWSIEDCSAIGGYEIYVDGHLTNRFYNFRHEAGVVANVDVTRGHQVILRAMPVGQEFGDDPGCDKNAIAHAHPEMLVGASRPWTPSVFFYEP